MQVQMRHAYMNGETRFGLADFDSMPYTLAVSGYVQIPSSLDRGINGHNIVEDIAFPSSGIQHLQGSQPG